MRGLSQHFPKSKKDALKRSSPLRKHNSNIPVGVGDARAQHPAAPTAAPNAAGRVFRGSAQLPPRAAQPERLYLAGALAALPLSTPRSRRFLYLLQAEEANLTCRSPLSTINLFGMLVNTRPSARSTSRRPRGAPKPGAHLVQVAANPADLRIGKHTHTSSRPTCYTSEPKNNNGYL